MQIIVNGEALSVPLGCTIAQLIAQLGITEKVMAAAVDMQVVKQAEWDSYVLEAGARVELLQFVGGG